MKKLMTVQCHLRCAHQTGDFPCTLIYTLRRVCAIIGKREK